LTFTGLYHFLIPPFPISSALENCGTDESLCDIGPMLWGDGIVDRSDLEVLMEYYNQVVDVAAYYKLDETKGLIVYDSSGYYCDADVIHT
jgi:hypothetical protein